MNDKELAQLTLQIQNASNYRGLRRTLINEVIPYFKQSGLGWRAKILTKNKPAYRYHHCYVLFMYKILDLKCGMSYADAWLERNYGHLFPNRDWAFGIWQTAYEFVKKDAEA